MRLSGSYFDLTDRFAPNAAGGSKVERERVRLESRSPQTRRPGAGTAVGHRIIISVAKRLVPSAVRRNTVKRIVREAWRAAVGVDGYSRIETSFGTSLGSAKKEASDGTTDSPQDSAKTTTSLRPAPVCLVRLKRYPGTVVKPKPGTRIDKRAKPVVVASPPGLAAVKRQLRSDADQLFAAFLQGRPPRPARPGRTPTPS